MTGRQKKKLIITGIVLVLFLIGYSFIFRSYLDTDFYLEMAYAHTGYDPTIVDWRHPDYEIIQHKNRLAVHIIFLTTEDDTRGPIGLYIDPFRKEVFDEDPRASSGGSGQIVQ